ncbi:MAG: hypothetical protein LUO89_03450 [Methanothrix sp.]|nr:hypothetical protein [Methanothrix sp.]
MKKLLVAAIAAASLVGVGTAFAAGPEYMDLDKIAKENDAAHTLTLRDGKTFIVPPNLSLGEIKGQWGTWMYHKAPDGKLILDGYFNEST